MFELDETQQLMQNAVRDWCERELAPAAPALETGETLPYDLLRALLTDLGLAEVLVGQAERRGALSRRAVAMGAAGQFRRAAVRAARGGGRA